MIGPGTLLGPYEVLATLGSGGMGVVYRARDVRLNRSVAVKVLPPEAAHDTDRLRRFENEARAVSALDHPNILVVHDVGTHEGLPYIVSELLDGVTLRHHLASGRISLRKAMDYAVQLATGLAAAHDKGIVHRDLKPENVFVTDEGRVKILDFGLARITRREADGTHGPEMPTQTIATEPGVVMGTAPYMSPEQVRGLPSDRRSDVFGLGVILYELFSGERPFKGPTPADTMTAILTKEPFDATNSMPALPSTLQRVIVHCLEKKPEQRFQSARDVLFALETFADADGLAEKSKPRKRLSALVTLVLLGTLGLGGAAGLVIARRLAGARAPDPVFLQLTGRRGFVMSARFTRDGQSVVYGAAWDGRPVELFTTQASRAGSTALAIPPADVLSVSSSGELALSLGRQYVAGFATSGTLARATGGTAPREVLENVQDAEWDGNEHLVVVRRVGEQHRLEWPIGRVLYTTAGWISHPRLSPNRKLVAFFDHPIHGDDRGTLAVVDKEGLKRILSHPWSSLSGLAWSSSGEEVWFAAARETTNREIWGVSLTGEVRSLLRAPGSFTLYDVASDGRLLVGQESLRSIVTGMAPVDRSEHDLSWTDFSLGHDLSIDGQTVLLSENGLGTSPMYDVYLRRMDGSPAVRLGEGQPMALSPDGKWVLTLMLTSPPELALLPTRAGHRRRLPRGKIEEYAYFACWFPDGKRVMFQGREPGGQNRLYVQSVEAGEPRALLPDGVHLPIFSDPISPDGRLIAALGPDDRVRLYGIDGSTPSLLPGLATGETPLLWSRDATALFTVERRGAAHLLVNRTDVRSHRKTLVRDIAPSIPGLMSILHVQAATDANAYVYTYWQRLSDLYVVSGVR
jgi:eukaryotic-like serine/threonine-protein kinase